MRKKRPVNLNLMTIRFPVTAISSILHRVSGFLLFLVLPFFLWALSTSFSEEGFARFQQWQGCLLLRLAEWFLLSGLIYHLIAGVRHLIMDAGYWEEKVSGRVSAWIVIILSTILIIIAGGWLL